MPADRPVLGIDTATPAAGIALISGDEVLDRAAFSRAEPPSRALMPTIKTMLESAGLELKGLHALVVTVGPGGFTGIRVGLTTARALGEAAGLPVAGVSTLAAMAMAAGPADCAVVPWLDGGRTEIYAGLFGPGQVEFDECVAPPAQVLARLPAQALLFVGDGAQRYEELIGRRPGRHAGDEVRPLPTDLAAAAARLGCQALKQGTALPLTPRYLRPPDATRARA